MKKKAALGAAPHAARVGTEHDTGKENKKSMVFIFVSKGKKDCHTNYYFLVARLLGTAT